MYIRRLLGRLVAIISILAMYGQAANFFSSLHPRPLLQLSSQTDVKCAEGPAHMMYVDRRLVFRELAMAQCLPLITATLSNCGAAVFRLHSGSRYVRLTVSSFPFLFQSSYQLISTFQLEQNADADFGPTR